MPATYRKPITVTGAQIPGALTDFPLLVDVGGDTDVIAHARSDLGDVRFYDSNGTTPLAHQWVNQSGRNLAVADGAWSWFSEPRSICYSGTKRQWYAGWVTSDGTIQIGSRDLDTGASATFTLHSQLEVDDHDNPVILVRSSDKRLLVFYAKHNAESQLYYRISTNPEDITAWGSEQTLATGGTATYSNVFQLSGGSNPGRIYWLYRLYDPGLQTFRTSDNGGVTWSAETSLFTPEQAGARPYLKYTSDGVSKIHAFFTDGHPRDVTNCDLHHVYLENGNFYQTDGTLIAAISAGPLLTSSVAKIYDAGTEKSWCWDICLDPSGKPVVTFATFPTETTHRYYYAKWDGGAWNTHVVVDNAGPYIATVAEPQYSGGIVLDTADTNTVYTSVKAAGTWEIQRRTTSDGGSNWTTTDITAASSDKQVRPYSPRYKLSGCPDVMWMSGYGASGYTTYQNYHTALKCSPAIFETSARRRARVKVPSLSAGVAKTIYMRYGGNPGQYATPGVYDASQLAVWQYEATTFGAGMVNIMTDCPGGGIPTDPATGTGLTGTAFVFSGDEQWTVGRLANLAGLSTWTISFWVKMPSTTGTHYFVSSWQQPTHPAADFMIRAASGVLSGFMTVQTDTQIGGAFPDLVIGDTNWHRVTLRFDASGNDLQMMLDGVLSSTTFATAAVTDATGSNGAMLGGSPHAPGAAFLTGTMEPPEISNVARSANYELLRTRVENAPGSTLTFGTEEAIGEAMDITLPAGAYTGSTLRALAAAIERVAGDVPDRCSTGASTVLTIDNAPATGAASVQITAGPYQSSLRIVG